MAFVWIGFIYWGGFIQAWCWRRLEAWAIAPFLDNYTSFSLSPMHVGRGQNVQSLRIGALGNTWS
jgi:hypothetical protein